MKQTIAFAILALAAGIDNGCHHPKAATPVPAEVTGPSALGDPEDPNREDDVSPTALDFPTASSLPSVTVTPGPGSALVTLPSVSGAADYRAFRLPAGTTLSVDSTGAETVVGTTLYCAGLQQHNLPLASPVVLQELQVNDLPTTTTIIVEAIDTLCPFPGVVGHTHADLEATAPQLPAADLIGFSVFTEAEVRSTYGSMIFNGQGPGPTLGAPAPAQAPHVLARSIVQMTPATTPPPTTFFDDFSVDILPTKVADLSAAGRTNSGQLFQTPTWSFYSYGCYYCEFAIERGQLNMIVADYSQDVMASNLAYPRQVAHLDTTNYLHITYQVPSNATQRRYWWLSLCGSGQVGQTLDGNGNLTSQIIPAPFFDAANGLNPSLAGWNCLEVFPRDGSPFPLPPGPARPESDVRVMLNGPPDSAGNNVVNVSPAQYPADANTSPSWYRQMDANSNLVAPMLDDQLNIEIQTTFDVYVRRDRVVVYAQGQQRLCNDFPSTPLTMAEAAVGFGQILFDSADEFLERSDASNNRTGQVYYNDDTPYIDMRGWDNIGFQEQVAEPSGFDSTLCYVYQ